MNIINDIETPTWKFIPGYEGCFSASTNGQIAQSLQIVHNKVIKSVILSVSKTIPYYTVKLGNDYYPVHRLIALTFIANPDNKPVVKHKNGIKIDNRSCNLEWTTQKDNAINAIKFLGPNSIGADPSVTPNFNIRANSVRKFDIDNKPIEDYQSVNDAAKQNGITPYSIYKVLNGKAELAGDCKWRYRFECIDSNDRITDINPKLEIE